MSTRSTIKLTKDNEHIHYDLQNGHITIEVDEKNIVDLDGEKSNFYVDIDISSELGIFLMNELVSPRWNGKDFNG